jgi:hypothetical protein
MNKLRTDAVFSQLTPEQVETLEGWLFEENLGYKEALERVEKEFNVKGSLSGLRRFYRRLARERSREDLVEMASVCADALATAKTDGTLQAGLLTLGYKCAMELLVQSPERVREFTALLRALTSAQALEMKRIEFQREEDRIKRCALEHERKEAEQREGARLREEREEAQREAREEKRRAKEAAKAMESVNVQGPMTKEAANPKLQIIEEKAGTNQPEVVLSGAGDKAAGTNRTDEANKAGEEAGSGAETPRVAA